MTAGNGVSRGARSRYIRHFVERRSYLLQRLTPDEFFAHARIELRYVENGGPLPDDDALARAAGMRMATWARLRGKLLALGLLRVEAGLLIDDDQDRSLATQERSSQRGRAGAAAKWGGLRSV